MHVGLAASRWRGHLTLSELAEGRLLGLDHVAVIREVSIVGASFVLQGFDWGREIDFTFEKLLARNLVQFVRWHGVRAHRRALHIAVDLHAHFLTPIRGVLLLLVEVRDVAVGRLTFPSDLGEELLSILVIVHRRFRQQLRVLLPVLVHVGRASSLLSLVCLVYVSWLVYQDWLIISLLMLLVLKLLVHLIEFCVIDVRVLLLFSVVGARHNIFSEQVPEKSSH